MTLTKAELAKNLHDKLGLNKREAMEVIVSFFEEIAKNLVRNDKVKISGFGNFETRDKRERPGRNPKTGEPAVVTARRVVKFCAGQKLRSRVGQNAESKP